jgi:hypothetical protein
MAVRKIVQFGICAANTDGELAGLVNRQIKEGWELHGVVFTSVQQDQLFFHQAMVAYANSKAVTKIISRHAAPIEMKNRAETKTTSAGRSVAGTFKRSQSKAVK